MGRERAKGGVLWWLDTVYRQVYLVFVAAFDVARMLAGGPGAAEPLWQTTQSSDGLCVTEEGVVILTSRLLFFQGVRQHAAAAAGRDGGLTD